MGSNLKRKLAAALGCGGYPWQPFRTGFAGFFSQVDNGLMFEKLSNINIRCSSGYPVKVNRSQRQRSSGRDEASRGGLLYKIVVEDDNATVKVSKERINVLKQRSQDGALGSLFNAEMLPYMKYVLGERVWNRFIHGSSTKQEKKKVLDALEKILLRRRDQIGLLAVIKRHQENNERSLRSCISKKDPISTAEKLERLKSKICAVYNIEESEFQKCKLEALETIEQDATHQIAKLE